MITIVDYGLGNIRAFLNVYRRLNIAATTARTADELAPASRIILPGVGSFDHAVEKLSSSGMRDVLGDLVMRKRVPVLGVCVGMQMLLDHSEEQDTPGLGVIPGRVRRFRLEGRQQPDGSRYKVPQMGWNRVRQSQPHALWHGVADGAWFYFVHSFYVEPSEVRDSAGLTDYGVGFTSAVARDNIFATQFHPEKSAADGLTLYRNFLHWKP